MNPIHLIKNGIVFPIEKLGLISLPFSFRLLDGKEFLVKEKEQPIFFTRQRMRVSGAGNVKSKYIHRYCVGINREDGSQEKSWIYPDGTFDVTGDKPSN